MHAITLFIRRKVAVSAWASHPFADNPFSQPPTNSRTVEIGLNLQPTICPSDLPLLFDLLVQIFVSLRSQVECDRVSDRCDGNCRPDLGIKLD